MKLAMIGSGTIIRDAFYALKFVENIKINAIYVREHSIEKGKLLASENGLYLNNIYTDYMKLLKEADIDCVYIGIINSAHYEFAKCALLNGKNVIVEKPYTDNYSKAKELYDLAKKKNLMIFEAINVIHSDIFNSLHESLNLIGPIKLISANFSQYSSVYDKYLSGEVSHSFDKKHLGGSLRDLNLYNIHYVVALFGMPIKAKYYPNRGYNKIDTSGVLILVYRNFICVLTAAKDSDSECFFSIQGEKGTIRMDGKPNVPFELKITTVNEKGPLKRDAAGGTVRSTIKTTINSQNNGHRLCSEFKNFATIIDEKDFERADFYMKETLDVMMVIDMLAGDL